MRLLYLQPSEGFGGAERQAVLAARRLPEFGIEVLPVVGAGREICGELERCGVRNYVFLPAIGVPPDRPSGIPGKLARAAKFAVRWRLACAAIAEVAARWRPDLIMAGRTFGWAVAAGVRRRWGVPVVWRAGSRATSAWQTYALRLGGRFGRPDAVVANCRSVADSIGLPLGSPLFVVPNGVETGRFAPMLVVGGYRTGLPSGAAVVGVAARPSPEKGFDVLARVVRLLADHVPSVHFLVAGEYGWRPHFEAEFQRLGLAPHVRFLGHVRAMPEFYASCDVILLTSVAGGIEGFPNSLLEAMAMERPVVATRVGGVPELVAHGVNGLLADPGDAAALAGSVQRVLAEPTSARRLGMAARESVVGRFSERAVAAALAAVLRRVLATAGERHHAMRGPADARDDGAARGEAVRS